MRNQQKSAVKRLASVALAVLLAFSAALPVFAVEGDSPEHVHVASGEPVWNWSDDRTSCTALFSCADCGETFTLDAEVIKEWRGEGPDKNGGGRYLFIASVTVDGRKYSDRSPEIVTEGYKDPDPCPWDGIDHDDSVMGRLTRFFHRILYFFAHMFELGKYEG